MEMTSFDLTQSQRQIWVGQILNPEEPLYNMALSFELMGVVDTAHFAKAFEALVDKADALRIVFQVEDGILRQHMSSEKKGQLEIIDWSGEVNLEEKYRLWSMARSKKVFDLSQCLFDSVLIKFAEDRLIWYFNQHHLITDGWSMTVAYKKLAELYEDSINGSLEEAEALPSFQLYQAHEQKLRDKANSKAYWQSKMENLPVTPRLYGYENQGIASDSQRYTLDLGRERTNRLRALTSEVDLRAWTQHMSLFNIFATVLFTYLFRVGGQRRISIGTPSHNRVTNGFRETTGLFIELFPLVTSIDNEESFLTLFKKVQLETNSFLRNAEPGASTPELSRGFNVVLNYINATFPDFAGIPMKSEWVHPGHADAGHVLRLQVHDFDNSGSIKLHFDLNTSVFPEVIREKVVDHFLILLEAFIADRAQPLGAPGLQKPVEKPLNTDVPAGNVVKTFEARVSLHPEFVAIDNGEGQITFKTLNQKANQLARLLRSKGVTKGKHVAIHLKRSSDFIIAMLGILKAGGTYVPIDSSFSQVRVSQIIEDVQSALLITSERLNSKLDEMQGVDRLVLSKEWNTINQFDSHNLEVSSAPEDLVYILYTSGSTGKPKGVMITNENLNHYIEWARKRYEINSDDTIPFFTSVGFDLTVTSLFLPLVSGARLIVYPEADFGPDLSVFELIEDNQSSFVKLTPSHLALIDKAQLNTSAIKKMVIGGEDLKYSLAKSIHDHSAGSIRIFNEYGPTEVTVGCIVGEFDPGHDQVSSVPIGKAISGIQAHVLDEHLHQVPSGVVGELYLSGVTVAQGYLNQPDLTSKQFLYHPLLKDTRMYKTGDLVRQTANGDFQYLGRADEQVKINGRRVELGEIESAIGKLEGVESCVVELRSRIKPQQAKEVVNCNKCGLPSNYPNVTFNDEQVCSLCQSYEDYRSRVKKYFKTFQDFKGLFAALPEDNRAYDCIVLLSGGKDSTYALAKVVDMGMKVLAFTLDNGYISDQAKANIRRVVNELGVDHMFGETPVMNDIFVDSLKRHCNVCDGCFKTIYTLSMKVALEKNIPYIVTGLSRGQFFETRLTEELFRSDDLDVEKIDQIILNIRKTYHRVDDAVKRLLDVTAFEDDQVFEDVKFLDFYRYTDVSLDEMLQYLEDKLTWRRPTDTGRSTNCLINQAGIFVHKKERGYSNYAFPYSWDVRLGHKTRDASLEEINEEINEKEVAVMLEEIGYSSELSDDSVEDHLVAYYVASQEIDELEIRRHLELLLPEYMIPVQFLALDGLPLNENGKIDKSALPVPDSVRPMTQIGYVAPRSDIEEMLVDIWSEVLNIDQIGVFDRFIELGGTSLAAIRIISRTNEAFELDLPMNSIFNQPTIAGLADFIRETITKLLEEMDPE